MWVWMDGVETDGFDFHGNGVVEGGEGVYGDYGALWNLSVEMPRVVLWCFCIDIYT